MAMKNTKENTLIQCSRKVTYENVANVSLRRPQQSKDGCDKESTCHHNYCWRSQHSACHGRAAAGRSNVRQSPRGRATLSPPRRAASRAHGTNNNS